ncbi:MAG: hypothetical protein OXQ96_07195 [Alphaproteobacteria bacterium]|nr:hypothetical protein [Alphaproteobacteria bacterium]
MRHISVMPQNIKNGYLNLLKEDLGDQPLKKTKGCVTKKHDISQKNHARNHHAGIPNSL